MEFMGIKNVVDMEAILGNDGMADGFRVTYNEPKEIKLRSGKVLVKDCLKQRTVYVREFNPESVASDGVLHGFGNGLMIKRSVGKKDAAKKSAASKVQPNLGYLNTILGRK